MRQAYLYKAWLLAVVGGYQYVIPFKLIATENLFDASKVIEHTSSDSRAPAFRLIKSHISVKSLRPIGRLSIFIHCVPNIHGFCRHNWPPFQRHCTHTTEQHDVTIESNTGSCPGL